MTLLCALGRPSPQAELYEIDKTVFDADGKPVLISDYHNFQETPFDLETILQQLPEAKFKKIATFARTTIDSLRMLAFVQDHPGVIGLCMGELGEITRILAPVVGTPLMYAPEDEKLATAPGQLTLQTLLETYHFRKLRVGTPIFGLIGDPVVQSPGHIYHNARLQGRGVYVKMRIQKEELADFFHWARKLPFHGLSVTTPHKKSALAFLDDLDPEAAAIGAVNTIVVQEGRWVGYNTDGLGALKALGDVQEKRIAILGGRGGAGRAIAHEAKKQGSEVATIRRGETPGDYDILINATGEDNPAEALPGTTVMELSLKTTTFLQEAQKRGCHTISGIEMYRHQAEFQLKLFLKTPQRFCQ